VTAKVRKSSRAEEDLINIWLYVAERDAGAADRLLDRFEARWQLLATQPRSGVRREDLGVGLRTVVIGEYLSVYRLEGNTIEIVRVLHGRRRITPSEMTDEG
jgi:toxin ParE1/3/4